MNLRPYQAEQVGAIYRAWQQGARNVIASLPTGGGKTVEFAHVLADHRGPSVAIAHRQELVSQISLALAREGLYHRIIAPKPVVQWVASLHRRELGADYHNPTSRCAVAGVDTLLRRSAALASWAESVTLWVQDEAHHVLRGNKWGKAAALFPNARGLGVTATPGRADGRGLGRHADGLFDVLVPGPPMRWLIEQGHLTDYRIFAPQSDIDLESVPVSAATGDYIRPRLRAAARRSHIVGDVVAEYLKHARGKLGITFATDVETAGELAEAYRAAGVPAAAISSKTQDQVRTSLIDRFRHRDLLQLVNVDIFGEGFDLPAIEVVSMARPTASFAVYAQQFGRALRPMEGKGRALIIDHVQNVQRHRLPDGPRVWSLDRREGGKRKAADAPPVKVCPECTAVYPALRKGCPWCGYVPEPINRSAPEFVEGDLTELDPAALAELRGEVARVDVSPASVRAAMERAGAPPMAALGAEKQFRLRQEAQRGLRDAVAWWGAHKRAAGVPDPESYREFWHRYGVDVVTAQTLGRREAAELEARVREDIGR